MFPNGNQVSSIPRGFSNFRSFTNAEPESPRLRGPDRNPMDPTSRDLRETGTTRTVLIARLPTARLAQFLIYKSDCVYIAHARKRNLANAPWKTIRPLAGQRN